MSLDTIPTRANGTEIDQTWFNITQAVLGADFVPRNSGGVPTDQGGGLGTLSYSWLTAYLMTLKLRAATSGNVVTVKALDALAASYQISLPSALPSVTSYLTIDSSGNLAVATKNTSAAATGSTTGNAFQITATSYTDVCSVTLVSTGNPVLIQLQADSSGSEVSFANGGVSDFYMDLLWDLDGGTYTSWKVNCPATRSMGLNPGGFSMIHPSPAAGSHTYKLRCKNDTANTAANFYSVKLMAKELA